MKQIVALAMAAASAFTLGVGTAGAQTADLPYAIDFGTSQDGWTIVDQGWADHSWVFNEKALYAAGQYKPAMKIEGSWSSEQNDWYVSPAFTLEAGKEYTVSAILGYESVTIPAVLEVGTSATDMSANTVVGDFEVHEFSSFTDLVPSSLTVTVETTGTYYLSIHSQFTGGMCRGYLTVFSVEGPAGGDTPVIPDDPAPTAELPYAINFTETQDGWTAVDNNGNNDTWTFFDGFGLYQNSFYAPHNDDYLSPAFALKAGKTYNVKATVSMNGQPGSEAVSLMAGSSAADLAELKAFVMTAGPASVELQFAPEADGNYFFSFRNLTPSQGFNSVFLNDFSIEEATSEPEQPEQPGLEVPYSTTFNQEPEGWKAIDNDGNNDTWTFFDGFGLYQNSFYAPHNDDYLSPAFALKAGKTYNVKATVSMNGQPSSEAVSLMAGSSAADLAELKAFVMTAGPASVEVQFAPEADGNYFFSFRNLTPSQGFNSVFLNDFSIEEATSEPEQPATPAEVPYSINFVDSLDGWTIVDNNPEAGGYFGPQTWATDFLADWGVYLSGMYGPHNDDFISPKFTLKGGTTYKITAGLSVGSASADDALALMAGTDTSDLTEIKAFTTQNGAYNEEVEFTPESDGDYCFAFRNTSPSNYTMYLGVTGFAIEEAETTEPEEPGLPVPYTIAFAESQEGWTAIDQGREGTWTFKPKALYDRGQYMGAMNIEGSSSVEQSDWYVSPAITLEAGKTYTASATVVYDKMPMTAAIEIGKSATDMEANTVVGDLATAMFDSFATLTPSALDFTVETTGTYYLSVHAQFTAYTTASLVDFSVTEKGSQVDPEPEDPTAEVPYSINFKESHQGWTAIDNNPAGGAYTWKEDFPEYGVYMEGQWGPHNDDYLSPIFTLTAGQRYKLTTAMELLAPTGNDIVAMMAGADKDALTEIARLSVSTNGVNSDEMYFTPDTDGEYRFAFRNTSPAASFMPTQYIGLTSFTLEVAPEEPAAPLVSTDFTEAEPLKGWTVLDANNDGLKWAITPGVAGVTYTSEDAAGASDDWLISPAMELTADQDYLVEFTLAQAGAFDSDLVEVYLGTEPTAEGMTTLLATERPEFATGNGTLNGTTRFTAEADGLAHVGFHVATPEPNGRLSLVRVNVTPVEKAIPTAVSGLKAESDKNEGIVTLTWTNPATDTTGAPIDATDIRILANEVEIATLEGCEPGAKETYSYKPEPFTGDVIYSVVAVLGEYESEPAEVTICLDDIQGKYVLVASLPVTYDAFESQWATTNGGGTSGWTYDMGFFFKHNLGQPTDEDDWLFSPSFALETNKRYVVRFRMGTGGGQPASFTVNVGRGQNAEAQTKELSKYDGLGQNGLADFETKQFSVDEAADYNVGLYVSSVASSITLKAVDIYQIEAIHSSVEDVDAGAIAIRGNRLIVADGADRVAIYDAAGRLVSLDNAAGATTVVLPTLPAGIYLLQVTDRQGRTTTLKLAR